MENAFVEQFDGNDTEKTGTRNGNGKLVEPAIFPVKGAAFHLLAELIGRN